jgi:hypothetical protein
MLVLASLGQWRWLAGFRLLVLARMCLSLVAAHRLELVVW